MMYILQYIELNIILNMLDDGKLDTESDSGEFWVLFGGFAPIGKKVASEDDIIPESAPAKLYRFLLEFLDLVVRNIIQVFFMW